MTFQRSLYISVFAHLLLFGSAIAIAEYARGTFWSNRDFMMVSLVGPDAHSGVGAERVRQAPVTPVVKRHEPLSSPIQSAQPDSSVFSGEKQELLQERLNTGTGDADGREQGNASEPASGTVAGFGLVSAEQWAVISSAIERSKSYPRMARERGIQGIVHLRFKLKQSGEVDLVEIIKSSGYDILDTASVRTIYRSGPLPYVSGWIEVPIAYVLK